MVVVITVIFVVIEDHVRESSGRRIPTTARGTGEIVARASSRHVQTVECRIGVGKRSAPPTTNTTAMVVGGRW